MCVILRLAVLVKYRYVRHTHTHTHPIYGTYRTSIAARVKRCIFELTQSNHNTLIGITARRRRDRHRYNYVSFFTYQVRFNYTADLKRHTCAITQRRLPSKCGIKRGCCLSVCQSVCLFHAPNSKTAPMEY